MMIGLLLVAAQTAASAPKIVEAMTAFEAEARNPAQVDINQKALAVCRAILVESMRGNRPATDIVTSYKGPYREVLTFTCEGYMQAANDILYAQRDLAIPAK